MEKRRIRLDIDGVVCRLITQEDDRYMEDLAKEIGEQLEETRIVSPYITREAAALTAALNYCDEAKKKGRLNALLKDRVEELEVEKELWLEEKAELKKKAEAQPDLTLQQRAQQLEQENARLAQATQEAERLSRENSRLSEENESMRKVLQQAQQKLEQRLELRQRLVELEEENRKLRAAAGDSQQQKEQRQREAAQRSADLEEKVQQLADLVEEQGELTRETVGSLHQEPEEQAAPQPEAPKDRGISPALDLLERTAQENSAAPALEEEEEEEQPASSRDKKRRKNPLRHEDEYVQEGLVSFFEKK